MPNYYDVLGVSRTATARDIRQAYRKLARQYHPDVNPGDNSAGEKFKQMNEAHSVLSDAENRRKYDRYGDRWAQADQIDQAEAQARRQDSQPTYTWTATGGREPFFDGSEGASNVFKNLGQDFRRPVKNTHPIEISLEEAYQGATRVIELTGGRRLEVKIPAGVDNASLVHIPAGRERDEGFYLVVSVRPHPTIQRQGRALYEEVEVALEDAVLGGEVTVPTLVGKLALTIPPETQNGQRFRMAGQGMPGLNQPGVRGALYATIKVTLPSGLTEQDKELFRKLRENRASRRR